MNALKKRKADLVPVIDLPEKQAEEEDNDVKGLTVEHVRQALEKLPEGYRVIFSLYLLEGYDHVEILQIMGISEETSKSQYSRARQRMKEIIKHDFHGRQV
jgi:RNA polymerase sigma-70 factor (ECF subfamily)